MLNRTRDDHNVNSVFLRAIGALALASHDLDRLRGSGPAVDDAWHDFADHLAQAAGSVMDGAAGSTFPGNTISIVRDGVHVAVDEVFIEKLTDKIHRHVRVGRALGLADADVDTMYSGSSEAVPA